MKEVTLQIPDNMCPDKVREIHGCLLRFFEPKEEPKFKRGDIVYIINEKHEFEYVAIFKDSKLIENYYYTCLTLPSNHLSLHGGMILSYNKSRLATTEEKQRLFTALAKEGKRWNAETLEIENVLRVPENIKLYQPKKNDDQIYIGFGSIQMLGVYNDAWNVMINDEEPCEPIQCELIPCKREDLKAGDTAFTLPRQGSRGLKEELLILDNYCKIINSHFFVYAINERDVESNGYSGHYSWYKVVPIKE